ncbi:hypothetical protein [Pontibacter silvestris]|uniref:hypothetical protein n=1 Tax=Pontibacter silvestris TaxID=2305183 RepID=UPI001E52B59B|nr:hypothetical protein [Pontibacter silvestris]
MVFYTFAVIIVFPAELYFSMEFMIGKKILSLFGRGYLFLRYRNKKKVQQELERKFEGQFRNAGVVLLADIFMALAVVAIVSFVAAVLYFLMA